MKVIKREELIERLQKVSGYYKYNIKDVLTALDKVVYECFDEIGPGETLQIQLLSGVKLQGKYVPERERVDPRNMSPIICSPTIKPGAVFSDYFRDIIDKQIKEKLKNE